MRFAAPAASWYPWCKAGSVLAVGLLSLLPLRLGAQEEAGREPTDTAPDDRRLDRRARHAPSDMRKFCIVYSNCMPAASDCSPLRHVGCAVLLVCRRIAATVREGDRTAYEPCRTLTC